MTFILVSNARLLNLLSILAWIISVCGGITVLRCAFRVINDGTAFVTGVNRDGLRGTNLICRSDFMKSSSLTEVIGLYNNIRILYILFVST